MAGVAVVGGRELFEIAEERLEKCVQVIVALLKWCGRESGDRIEGQH